MKADFLARPLPDMTDPELAAGWFDVMALIHHDNYTDLLRAGDSDRAYEAFDLADHAQEHAAKIRRQQRGHS
jgi:hypothetical protein